ncbi:hypothetical protein Btru_038656 [Bulinus truncatus]|nr:hypothetical protein Btru_038656 [Bulinus truncatus]
MQAISAVYGRSVVRMTYLKYVILGNQSMDNLTGGGQCMRRMTGLGVEVPGFEPWIFMWTVALSTLSSLAPWDLGNRNLAILSVLAILLFVYT